MNEVSTRNWMDNDTFLTITKSCIVFIYEQYGYKAYIRCIEIKIRSRLFINK